MTNTQTVPGELLAEIARRRLMGESIPQITATLNRDPRFKPARARRFSPSTVRSYAMEAGKRLRLPLKLTTRRALAA